MAQYNYEDLLKSMHENVVELRKKLNDLDKVYQDIDRLKNSASEVPQEFQDKFDAIVAHSNEYMTSISSSVKIYLEGNNDLLTTNIKSLDNKINMFSIQIADFQAQNNAFSKEVDRISKADLEKEFRELQDTLSQIFQAIQGINIILTQISTTLSGISSNLNERFNTLENSLKEESKNIENSLQEKNNSLKKELDQHKSSLKITTILLVLSLFVSVATLVMILVK